MSYAVKVIRMMESLVKPNRNIRRTGRKNEQYSSTEELSADDYFEIMHNNYGGYLPQVFAEEFQAELEEQGLGKQADILITHFDDDGGEAWVGAWETILSDFVYDGEYYLHDTNDGLFAVRKGMYPPDWN